MDPRKMRPKPSAGGPDVDPPVQLKTESNLILTAEDGTELTTE